MEAETKEKPSELVRTKKALSWEALIFLVLLVGAFSAIGMKMGVANMLNTLMNTAFDLLLNTVFYIMAIAVLAGALSALLTEFGVVSAINKLLSPLMKPLYGLPGASIVGVLTTYLSDNPAILTLAEDRNFLRYFKKYQVPALTNIGTAFGMGLIISTFMVGTGAKVGLPRCFLAVLIGNLGAIVGSIVSTRLMLLFTAREFGREADAVDRKGARDASSDENRRVIRSGSAASRFLAAVLEGGQSGVEMGLAIIPGVLIICSLVMMLSKGAGAEGYTGAAYEGVALLPWLGEKIDFILKPLFGFQSPEAIAVPITALGAAGAAIGLVPDMLAQGTVNAHDIAVFTAMCMCWSGYLILLCN